MNIFKKLTLRNLKLNKKRTITTIIGIALSTALICATFGLVTSFQQSMLNDAIKSNGDYHATFCNVPREEQKYITENRNVESYFITQDVGYAKNDRISDEYQTGNQYWYIKEFNQKALEESGLNLVEGRFPQNENEVVIQDRTNGYVTEKYKIGDVLDLQIGERYLIGTDDKLTQQNPYIWGNEENGKENDEEKEEKTSLEELRLTGEERHFKIVGIIERVNQEIEPFSSPAFTIITYLSEDNLRDSANISVKFKDISKTYDLIEEMNTNGYEVETNSEVLRYSGVSKNDNVNTMLYTVAGIIVAIIIVSSVFVIKNSFQIMIVERNKQYGMFASIGATSKQIKKNILYEGLILGLIAVPIGILGSILAVYILILLVNGLIGDLANYEFYFYMPWMAILLGTALSALTIYLSCIIPARKAAKISPIEAIRSNNDIKIDKKKVKSPKIIKKIFKIGGVISYKNLKRSKKQYRTTVISLVVSITIFLALSAIMTYIFQFSGIYYYNNLGYNVIVRSDDENKLNEVARLEDADEYDIQKYSFVRISKNYANDTVKDFYGDRTVDYMTLSVIAIGDKYYNDLLDRLNVDKNDGNTGAILVDKIKIYKDNKYSYLNVFNLNEGDTVNCNEEFYDENGKNMQGNPLQLKILKRLGDEKVFGIDNGNNSTFLITSQAFLEENFEHRQLHGMYIQSEKPDKLSEDLKKIEDIDFTNYNEYVKENESMVTVIYIFVYGFIAVITLIGVTNIFNTITTNMALRSKEFAMLKSIGMTKKEFNSMIRLESIFYGAKALLIGIPLGLILSYLLYKSFTNAMETPYSIPFIPIVVCVLFVFTIVFITMKYSINKINKQNIIDTIRNDNI